MESNGWNGRMEGDSSSPAFESTETRRPPKVSWPAAPSVVCTLKALRTCWTEVSRPSNATRTVCEGGSMRSKYEMVT